MKKPLLTGLCALALSAALATPAAAVNVPVTVDGAVLPQTGQLTAGITYVPLRSLLDALGGWELSWDSESRSATAQGAGQISACPATGRISVNGTSYTGAVYLESGRTYVPLRTVSEALGLRVYWDASVRSAAVSTTSPDYTQEDLYWLSRVISAESRGESLTGQIAVGNVVLNRVTAAEFPNTIKGVVFDTKNGVQFEPLSNGTLFDPPTAQSVAAAKAVLAGENTVGEALYFYAPALSQGTWINANRTYLTTIGCHRFYL